MLCTVFANMDVDHYIRNPTHSLLDADIMIRFYVKKRRKKSTLEVVIGYSLLVPLAIRRTSNYFEARSELWAYSFAAVGLPCVQRDLGCSRCGT
jgi:hypothetical protein